MKKIISILCVITMLFCLAIPSNAGDRLTVCTIEDGSELLTLNATTSVPSSYDARTTGYVPAVRNQGETGACWAFATMAAMEIDACKQGLKSASTVDFSEAHLVWFAYSADKNTSSSLYGEQYISSTPYKVGGNWNRAAGTLAKWSGVANESDFKFYNTEANFSKMSNYAESARYNKGAGIIIKDAEYLTTSNDVKTWIINHGACTATINWNINNYNRTNTSYYTTATTPNHMITVIGWNDSFSKNNFTTKPSGNGAWLIRDSRGDNLANGGYFWISYYDASIQEFAGFTAQKSSNYDNNYTYNAVGFSSATSCANGSTVANIFTTTSKQNLKAVSVFTASENTTCDIKIYTGFSGVNVTSGKCINQKKVTFANKGFHTVVLGSANELASGTKFAVAVTYSSTGDKVEIPVELKNQTKSDVKYTNKAGQSAALLSGSKSWKDASDLSVGNFYIQAFTTNATKQYEKGDVTMDSVINSTDALLILQSVVGYKTLSTEQKKLADVNGDSKINSTDALAVLKITVGQK